MSNLNIAVIGASGGIGSALVRSYSAEPTNTVHALSRSTIENSAKNVQAGSIDFADEASIEAAAESSACQAPLDIVVVASGFLHNERMKPEKALRDVKAANFERNFFVNTIGPALVAKYFLPKLHRSRRAVFASLSARVGSIEDNQLGGWYAYRASKAALNMLLKTASIEMARKNKQAIVIGLHPGTVATALSEPFRSRVPSEKLFATDRAARQLIDVMNARDPVDSGKVFAWDGAEIPY